MGSRAPGSNANSEKCLICYGPHTPAGGNKKGIAFELKNLKDIFTKSFGIKFLPHFSSYGSIRMCQSCRGVFLKLQNVFDAGDVKGGADNFDYVREQFAFIVVDSIIKSQYICNYVHGNAFDAIRFLVFKEWSAKFKKHNQEKQAEQGKPNNSTATPGAPTVPTNSNIEVISKSEPKVQIKATPGQNCSETRDLKKETSSNTSCQMLKATGQDVEVETDTVLTETKDSNIASTSGSCNSLSNTAKSLIVSPITGEAKTLNIESTGHKPQVDTPDTMRSGTEQNLVPEIAEQKVEPEACEAEARVNENAVRSSALQQENENESVVEPDPGLGCQTDRESPGGGEPHQQLGLDSECNLSHPPSPSPSLELSSKQVSSTTHSTYILSTDGQKLMCKSGELFPKHKLIFVKRDPRTGKMVQVPRPNFSIVKGKLNGKEVIVRSSNFKQSSPAPVPNLISGASAERLLPLRQAQASSTTSTPPPPPASPPIPRIISVQSMQQVPRKQDKEDKTVSTTVTKESSATPSPPSSRIGQGTSAERQQSTRSGRAIKRTFNSSSYLSGQELDDLLAETTKNSRKSIGNSPGKRQKADNRAPADSTQNYNPALLPGGQGQRD